MIRSVKVLDCYDRYCSEQVKWMSGWVGCDGDQGVLGNARLSSHRSWANCCCRLLKALGNRKNLSRRGVQGLNEGGKRRKGQPNQQNNQHRINADFWKHGKKLHGKGILASGLWLHLVLPDPLLKFLKVNYLSSCIRSWQRKEMINCKETILSSGLFQTCSRPQARVYSFLEVFC